MISAPDHAALLALHFADVDRRVLAAIPANLDHFAFFALPRRLQLDLEALRAAWIELSRAVHPDYFGGAEESQRRLAVERSARLNNAWRALRDAPSRAEYFLSLEAPEIVAGHNAVPPELLEDFFDIQEAGEELKAARLSADGSALAGAEAAVLPHRERVRALREDALGQLNALMAAVDDAPPEERSLALVKLRTQLDRLNYLRTVLRNLK